MITIGGRAADVDYISQSYEPGSMELIIIEKMAAGEDTFAYGSISQLDFELKLRVAIIAAARALYNSSLAFRVFRYSFCNADYWIRGEDGGFGLKPDVLPSDAIGDIYTQSKLYGTECATAMVIVYYGALLDLFPKEDFDNIFNNIYLMNWHRLEPQLREVGRMSPATTFLPGDRRYITNPDVNPETPQWQGENIIDMGDGTYYGHGIGMGDVDSFIEALNDNRKKGATKSAYLMDSVGRPNFRRLYGSYERPPANPRRQ